VTPSVVLREYRERQLDGHQYSRFFELYAARLRSWSGLAFLLLMNLR
jgi:hypothetical protein